MAGSGTGDAASHLGDDAEAHCDHPTTGSAIEGDVGMWRAAHPDAPAANLRQRLDVRDADLAPLRGVRSLCLRGCDQPELTVAALEPLRGTLVELDVTGCSLALIVGCIERFSVVTEAGILTDSTRALRKMLSVQVDPPINAVIATGVLPRLVKLLAVTVPPRLQFEACWALTNVASGSTASTAAVIRVRAVPACVKLLSSPAEDVREQAVWALGNIAGNSVASRDLVISAGAVAPLLRAFAPATSKLTFTRNATWTISNLVRGKPLPAFDFVAPLLPHLAALVTSDDKETLADALWALSYLTDSDDTVQAFFDTGCVRRVVELLGHESPEILTPALRTVGNIVTGDEHQTQAVLDAGALQPMAKLLSSTRKGLRREASWLVSNVCAGTVSQIQAVIDANLILPLVALTARGEPEVSKEACWALSNATTGGSSEQIATLVCFGIIPPLKEILQRDDPRVQMVAIVGLANILCHRPLASPETYLELMEDAGIPGAIDALRTSPIDDAVAVKAAAFLREHFPSYPHARCLPVDSSDDDDASSAPRRSRHGTARCPPPHSSGGDGASGAPGG